MRISTSTLYSTGVARLLDQQTQLARTQQQIATGRRMLSPADDPVAAAQALDLSQAKAADVRLAANRDTARSSLNVVEGVLAQTTSLIQDVKALVVEAGNGSYDNAQRGYLANEVRGRLDELVGLANSTDGTGNYLFSGYQARQQPYTLTATGVAFQGDAGSLKLQVGASRQLAVSVSGQYVFQGNGQDLFKTLTDLAQLLGTPVSDAASAASLTSGLATVGTGLDQALDNVLNVRATVGASLTELDALDNAGEDRQIQYAQALSQLQDLDYNEAITRLSQQQATLEAAQKSFMKVSGLSLFDFLS